MNILISREFERQLEKYNEPQNIKDYNKLFDLISSFMSIVDFNSYSSLGFKKYNGNYKVNVYGIDLNIRSAERIIATFLHDYSDEDKVFLNKKIEINKKNMTIIFHRISEHDLQGKTAELIGEIGDKINNLKSLFTNERSLETSLELKGVYSIRNGNRFTSLLTEDKEEIVNQFIYHDICPLIIEGVAGSGKTEILKSVIIKENEQKPDSKILYITASQQLVNDVQSKTFIDSNKVKFETLNSLINKIDGSHKNQLDMNSLERMFKDGSFQNHHLFDAFRALVEKYGIIRIYGEIHGLILGKYYLSTLMMFDEYANLDDYHSITKDKNERKVIYQIRDLYQKYDGDRFYESNSVCFKLKDKITESMKFDVVVVDEVQDFTEVEFQFINNLVKGNRRIIISGDPNQTIYPTQFSMGNLKRINYLNNNQWIVANKLKENFRNSGEVTQFINIINQFRNDKLTARKIEQSLDEISRNPISGKIYLFKGDKRDLIRFHDSSDVIEIHSNRSKDKNSLKVQDVKGLEFNHVIAYNLLSDYKEILDEIFNKKSEEMHFYFNIFYVAVTRVLRNLILVEDKDSKVLAHFINKMQEIGIVEIVDTIDQIDINADESLEKIFQNGVKQLQNRMYKVARRDFEIILRQAPNYPNAKILFDFADRALSGNNDIDLANYLERNELFNLASYYYKSAGNNEKHALMALYEEDYDQFITRLKLYDIDAIDLLSDPYTNSSQKLALAIALKNEVNMSFGKIEEIQKLTKKIKENKCGKTK